MAWQQGKRKEAHAEVVGPRDGALLPRYGVSRQPDPSKVNGILCLFCSAIKSTLLKKTAWSVYPSFDLFCVVLLWIFPEK